MELEELEELLLVKRGLVFLPSQCVVFCSDFGKSIFRKAISGDIGIILNIDNPKGYYLWNVRTKKVIQKVPHQILKSHGIYNGSRNVK